MRTHYGTLLAYCVALACGACMNPAPDMPADGVAGHAPATLAADCGPAPDRGPLPVVARSPEPDVAAVRVHAGARLGACRGASPPAQGSCEEQLSGLYALAYDLDVVYQDETPGVEPAYDPGRGQLRMMFKAALRGTCPDQAPELTSLQLCGLTLPPLSTAADGGYQALTIPPERWDRPTQPKFETYVRASESMDMDPTRILLGIAEADAWPSFQDTPSFACSGQRQGSACFPDHDGDGEPGITVELPQPDAGAREADCGKWRLEGARTDDALSIGRPRASRLFLGLRTQLSGAFDFDEDCEGGSGMADAEDVALRVLDCTLDDGQRCNALQATYVDQHAPVFHVLHEGQSPSARVAAGGGFDLRPGRGVVLRARRLAAADGKASCQDVRTALEQTSAD